jgi:hypothetical protein
VYLGRGRMVRIALHRRYILVKMNVILVGAVQYMMDLTMLVGAVMNKIQQQQPQKTCEKIIRFFKYILFIIVLSTNGWCYCCHGIVLFLS